MQVSSGQDRSMRIWRRGEDLVFIEEEREREMEAEVDQQASNDSLIMDNTTAQHVIGSAGNTTLCHT